MQGAALIAAGFTADEAATHTFLAALSEDQRNLAGTGQDRSASTSEATSKARDIKVNCTSVFS
jgi:hypothetical protein